MEKKYQFFISSTFRDLIDERKHAFDIVLTANNIPAGMEFFTAVDDEQFEIIKKVIDLSDYYILLVGNRYGSINEKTEISYTEMEYNYAVSKKIPVLAFILNYSQNFDEDESSKIKLNEFKKRVKTGRMVVECKNKEELLTKLTATIAQAPELHKRPGWFRGRKLDYSTSGITKFMNDVKDENTISEEFNFSLLFPFQQFLIRLAIEGKFDYYSCSSTSVYNIDRLLNLINSEKISRQKLKLKQLNIYILWELIDEAFDIFEYYDFGVIKINDDGMKMDDYGEYFLDKLHEYYFVRNDLIKTLIINFATDLNINADDIINDSSNYDEGIFSNYEIEEKLKKIIRDKTVYFFK